MNNLVTHIKDKSIPVRIVTGAVVIVLLALSAWVLWAALLGAMSLVGIGICSAVLFTGVKLAPTFGRWIETKIVQTNKTIARENPIEEYEREENIRIESLKASNDAIIALSAGIKTLKDMVNDILKEDPQRDVTQYRRKIEIMENGLKRKQALHKQAEKALQDFQKFIKEERQDWAFNSEQQKLNQHLNKADQKLQAQSKYTEEARMAARTRRNQVFAELEQQNDDEVTDSFEMAALGNSESAVLEHTRMNSVMDSVRKH